MNDVSAPGAETPEQRAIEIRGPVCCPPPHVPESSINIASTGVSA